MNEIIKQRFFARINKTDTCWIWSGCKDTAGYGQLRIGKRMGLTHRVSWEIHNGPIPSDALVLHRCDVRSCVNPAHLFLGSYSDNAIDRDRKRRGRHSRLTHCRNGHPYNSDNTYLHLRSGWRQCRICRDKANEKDVVRQQTPEFKAKKKEYMRLYFKRNKHK